MALTKRYVTEAGAGDNSGTASDFSNAMTWAQMVSDLNTPRSGYKYIVKGNIANGTTTTVLTGDGTTTSPNIIEGCFAVEGDLDANSRTATGALNTTNFPVISYTGTTARFDPSGANNLILRNIIITSAASNVTIQPGAGCTMENVVGINTGTNAASAVIFSSATDVSLINCEFETSTTGAAYAVRFTGSGWHVEGCRITCIPGSGLLVRSTGVAKNNVIYDCTTGITTDNTSSIPVIVNNTIANCSGDGIDIITGSTGMVTIRGNHITGCGGYGIDFNTSTCIKRLGYNRFRDNASGNINGGGDWEEGTSVQNVTTDTGGDEQDFVDEASGDYSLIATAPAVNKATGYLTNIGANGTPASSGGGRSAIQALSIPGVAIF